MKFTGLTSDEVAKSRAKYGENRVTPPPRDPAWKLFLEKFKDPIILILLVATIISSIANILNEGGGNWYESLGILVAVILSTGISFLSESRANRAFDILNRKEDENPVKVIRNGKIGFCPKTELVVDDILFSETGDEIPADAEILEGISFHVDQSKFTGEPEPILKLPVNHPEYGLQGEYTYPPHRVLRGSTVLEGSAHLRVTAVGNATEMGRTVRTASEETGNMTPLQKQLARLGKVIAGTGLTLSTLLLVILIAEHLFFKGEVLGLRQVLNFLMVAITLVVVVVPEGLPMSVTMSLALSMRRMAKSNVLIRKLHACETIGAATVICSDKTGTLTLNQMQVEYLEFPCKTYLAEALCVNATASLNGDEVIGNPTEGALLLCLKRRGIDGETIRHSFTVEKQWPFTTANKWMATRGYSTHGPGSKRIIHFKGAPEVLLAASDRIEGKEGQVPLSTEKRASLLKGFAEEQDKGHRTLGFAYRESHGDEEQPELSHLTFLGFVGISDPVRSDVPDAIKACRKAGIDVKIVTGDTVKTASEIGRQIGMDMNSASTLDGRSFEALDPDKTLLAVNDLKIIARARPDDKMKLVKALQQRGEVVAATGDGTNDAPAMHHADVGIAMGKTGTAIAREAADIILLDDAFPSIVAAVLWGRSLYLNIQRFLIFQLTINLAAAGIALTGPFIGVDIPLTVIQMLWINLIMDTFAAVALASEPPTREVMDRPPRNPRAFIITRSMAGQIFAISLATVAVFLALVWYWGKDGISDHEKAIIFTGFVLFQFWNLLNVRLFGTNRSIFTENPLTNKVFIGIELFILIGQILITQFGGRVFQTCPLSLCEWLILVAATSVTLLVGELVRAIHKFYTRKSSPPEILK